jgi:hypothetical protein
MNFLMLLFLCLVIVSFALIALGILFFGRRKQSMKDGSYKTVSTAGAKDIRCGCGRGSCCAIE